MVADHLLQYSRVGYSHRLFRDPLVLSVGFKCMDYGWTYDAHLMALILDYQKSRHGR